MRRAFAVALSVVLMAAAGAVEFKFDEQAEQLVVLGDAKPWVGTQTVNFDKDRAEETYKVFTHIYDFEGTAPITKGAGGKYSHHRGLFIGWNNTLVGEKDFDTWHMRCGPLYCFQNHVEWLALEAGEDRAMQKEKIHWCQPTGEPFIEEVRTITAMPGEGGRRVIDFESMLTSTAGTIKLRGDLQHAGMQVRMANEVSEHEGSTQYILPEGAKELDDNEVPGAWWMCCSPVVRDKRYWIVHMTHKDLVTGPPVYSIRRYARFGAFFEPDLEEGKPLTVRFRVVVSENELDQATCQVLYDKYVEGAK